MTKLRINDRAAREMDEIYRYVARDSIGGAEKVVAAIWSTIGLLLEYPHAGHQAMHRGTRMYPLTRYPYLIYFQYLPRLDELRIRSIRHAARRRTIELREPDQEFRAAMS